jgi:predicted Ser/Thr protein kinase/TolA-binding protein
MIGTVVSHYRVIDKLGAGGMGVVYRAEDLRLGRHVAVKFLPETAGSDPLAIERFEREARTASALNHPHICTIHDVGHDAGRRFIVMELIEGVTLDRLIASGPLGLERVIEIGMQVCDALDAAHIAGILHRDIKPGNIFITRREQVKVMDFGLAKMMPTRPGATVMETVAAPHFSTSVGIAVGTVAYMSPEHARGEALDARSDIFSLGVVIYEMATGVQTFRGQTTAVIFDQILNRVPPAPSSVNPAIPPRLEQIVARALEKDRRVRYQSTRDLQADLERLQRDITTRRAVQAAAASGGTAVSVAQSWASRGQDGVIETLMMSGSAFAVPDGPPAPWSNSAGTPGPAPDSEDVDRERLRAAAATTVPPVARADAAPSAPSGGVFVPPVPASAAPPPLPAPVSVPGAPAGPIADGVTVGAGEVDPYAATIVAPPRVPSPTDSSADTIVGAPAPGAAASASAPPAAAAATAVPAARAVAAPKGGQPTLAPRRVSGQSAGPIVAAAVLLLAGLGGLGWWVLHRPELQVGASDAAASTAPAASPAPAPASGTPAATAAATSPAVTPAAATAAAPPPATTADASAAPGGTPAAPGAAATAPRRGASTTGPARAAEAARALASARTLITPAPSDEAMTALERVSVSYAGTPPATEALALTAELRQQRNELEPAINAWVAYAGRNGDAERAGEGLVRTADAAARARSQAGDEIARRALDELLTRFPTASRAVRALSMKMALEDRLKLKVRDSQFPDVVAASVLTARDVAMHAGTAPVAELALWRVASEYKERKLHALAAQAFADLATRFPNTQYEAWFSAAEIYDRQLRDPSRARDAYLKVPPSSSKYNDAQKRARR